MKRLNRRIVLLFYAAYFAIAAIISTANATLDIQSNDFDRLIMPCYSGGSSLYAGQAQLFSSQAQNKNPPAIYSSQVARASFNSQSTNSYQTAYSGSAAADSSQQARDGFSNLGQQIPRANTIDNFIALVTKVEAARPILARNVDQLIKILLNRFRMDDIYYDVRTRMKIGELSLRSTRIIPALLSPVSMNSNQNPSMVSDEFPELSLDQDEKCSMYFMLSHFIDKTSPLSPSLASTPIQQLTGTLGGQRAPNIQSSGAVYPAQSANTVFRGGAGGSRYPGPSPGYGSPVVANMNGFDSGLSINPPNPGNSAYGMNVQQPNTQFNQNYNNIQNTGQYSGTSTSNYRQSAPFIEGNARSTDERQALEYGVVTVAGQENAALALNRVLLGILAASNPLQTIGQLASVVHPLQSTTNTSRLDEELDPLYAVTLSDLWAVSAIMKSGKETGPRTLGADGKWNDTMCPTHFQLQRASLIRFTTAELLGGLDGFALGMLRRQLMNLGKNIGLSEMLRIYYRNKAGFRPQFAELSVCNRASAINMRIDNIRRQAELYLRLYQLNQPLNDGDITKSINRLEYFVEKIRQVASNQYAPPEICQDTSYNELSSMGQQDQCEIGKADVAIVLDTSPQANSAFMNIVVSKLAQRLGLSRLGNSLSVLTNQQDSTGFSGAYSFNAIVRSSTNTAEIGCALTHDGSRIYQGSQITEATRLMEMFERVLIDLDSEYLIRSTSSSSPSSKPSSYVSSLQGQYGSNGMSAYGLRNSGGAKVIIWFNYGTQLRLNSLSSGPTNWNGVSSSDKNTEYKFYEAKRYLRENFRGASVLAVATNRENVKDFVYDRDRDIFADIPQGGGLMSSSDYPSSYQPLDASTIAMLNGPADQLVNKLLQRMCEIPAVFQYPMCFRTSMNEVSYGFVSPGKKQYWMMSPKTFFTSRSVRTIFRVEGGRLRVCFGRMTKPDESAAKNPNQQYRSSGVSFNSAPPQSDVQGSAASSSSSNADNYNTGREYGICKDVSQGQKIEFIVDDPCYKKPIAQCDPFYYVIKEISNIGEGDINYMCKDEGCKTLDQVKFVMSHEGVTCSSAFRAMKANWFLIMISILTALGLSGEYKHLNLSKKLKDILRILAIIPISLYLVTQNVHAQQAGVHDFGQGRHGEKRGNYTPSEVLSIILLAMVIVAGLALTVGLCYYINKRNSYNRSSKNGIKSEYSYQRTGKSELASAMGNPDNFWPIITCATAFIVVGILMMVTGGVICLLYFTEITPPNYDSNYHRYVGSSVARIVGPLLVAFGGLLAIGDIIIVVTVLQYRAKKREPAGRYPPDTAVKVVAI